MARFKRKSVFKLFAASVFMTIVMLAGGIIFLSKSATTVHGFSLKTDRLIYRSDEHPDFSLKAKIISHSNFWDRLKKQVLAEGAPRTQVLYDGQPINMPVNVTSDGSGTYNVNLLPQNSVKPGKYTLKATIDTTAGPQTQQQNFAWGVLAVNTDKATYLPGETAKIQMAVLSSSGHTLCSAPLLLTVTAPDGSQSQPGVQASELCKGDTYITEPDYIASFTVGETGTYRILLRLGDSDYTLSDTFEVKTSVPFDITRAGPSRIYPPANYPMAFAVRASQDFKGTVADTLPKGYKITDSGGAKVVQAGDHQNISWSVDWKAGQNYSLNYHFKAPPDSPAFYFIGPLEFKDNSGASIYKEARRWQIAGDATFPQTSLISSFTGADENPLSEGGAWAGPWESGSPQMRRLSNAAKGAASNAKSYRTDVSAVNTEAYVDVTTLPTSGSGALVALRIQNPGNTSTATAYIWVYIVGTGFRWYTMTAGHTFTNIGGATFTPHTLAAGESIGASVIGSTITGYYKSGGTWTQVDSRTDTTVTGVGTVGIGADESVNTVVDNFGGGEINSPTFGPYGTGIIDTFNGADSNPIGSPYTTNVTGSGHSDFQRLGGLLAPTTSAASFSQAYYNTSTFGPDVEIWGKIAAIGTAGSDFVDFFVRTQSPGTSGSDSDFIFAWNNLSGTDTEPMFCRGTCTGFGSPSFTSTEIAAGDYIAFTALGSSSVRFEFWKWDTSSLIWTKIGTIAYTTPPAALQGAGNFGFEIARGGGARLDNFGGGTLPNTDQLMRGGSYFNASGAKQRSFWAN